MIRTRSPFLLAGAIVAAASWAPVAAQEVKQTPEDEQKLAKLQAFLADIDNFLPTVNLIDKGSLPVTFPYHAVREQVVVDADFGDGTVRRFMLDTGAPTVVTDEIAKAHGGDAVVEMATIAGGGVIEWRPVLEFPAVKVGGALDIAEVTGGVGWAADGSFFCVTQNGLIGAQTMRNAVWQIHYGDHQITVAASVDQLDHVADAIALPFTIKENGLSPSPMVEVGVGDGKLLFLVDTGGGVPLTINKAALAEVGLTLPEDAPRSVGFGSGAGGDFEISLAGMNIPIQLGNRKFMVNAVVGDGLAPTTQGNMGHSFLKNFVVTLDWSSQTLYLDPLFDGDTVPPVDAAGASIVRDGEQVHVSAIAKGGPADKAGLKVKEIVTQVDGVDVTGISAADFCKVQDSNPQTITTESGKTYDISLIKGFFAGGTSQ